MKTVNLHTKENVKLTLFPDNQPSVTLSGIERGDTVRVVAPLRTANNVLHLAQITQVLRSLNAWPFELYIPYLMGARSDRAFSPHQSFDLKVIAELINQLNFNNISILDPHSREATLQIHRSRAVAPLGLLMSYKVPNSIVIHPDNGAAIRNGYDFAFKNPCITGEMFFSKTRNGAIYGDAINLEREKAIYERLKAKGFASQTVLGIGSFTYQYNTRDTFGQALKATWVQVNGEGREIFKTPVTDDGTKNSATGLLCVVGNNQEGFKLLEKVDHATEDIGALRTTFFDGEQYNRQILSDIRSILWP